MRASLRWLVRQFSGPTTLPQLSCDFTFGVVFPVSFVLILGLRAVPGGEYELFSFTLLQTGVLTATLFGLARRSNEERRARAGARQLVRESRHPPAPIPAQNERSTPPGRAVRFPWSAARAGILAVGAAVALVPTLTALILCACGIYLSIYLPNPITIALAVIGASVWVLFFASYARNALRAARASSSQAPLWARLGVGALAAPLAFAAPHFVGAVPQYFVDEAVRRALEDPAQEEEQMARLHAWSPLLSRGMCQFRWEDATDEKARRVWAEAFAAICGQLPEREESD